jgi:diaminopimelate decarboxylase
VNNLENEDLEQQSQQEQKDSSIMNDIVNSINPLDAVDLIVETGRLIVNTSKDIVSDIADNIDIDISF